MNAELVLIDLVAARREAYACGAWRGRVAKTVAQAVELARSVGAGDSEIRAAFVRDIPRAIEGRPDTEIGRALAGLVEAGDVDSHDSRRVRGFIREVTSAVRQLTPNEDRTHD